MAFMTLALAQIAHLGNARSSGPVLRLRPALANPYAIVGVAIALALQGTAAFVPPLAEILRVVPLDLTEWMIVIVLGSLPALLGQGVKVLKVTRRDAVGALSV
jgi:magnesium-transporting ATPase (P-type)